MMRSFDSTRFTDLGAGQLVEALLRKEVSARELCDAAIERIERIDSAFNAIVVRDFARAREQAERADAALARGERAPLLGLPMTVKESFDVAGLPTTRGLSEYRLPVAPRDSVAVARLKRAGAVILGKSNVATRLGDWQTVNPLFGRTLHPRDPERTPGGSSGGSAVALATGMVPLELGSDIAGSIRVPANFCGVFGHKPSQGLLPMRGHAAPGLDGAPDPLDVIGPLARTASDLTLALDVLAGPDEDQAVAYRLALPPARHERLRGCRVLLLSQHPSAPTDSVLRGALDELGGDLERAGASVRRDTPLLPDLASAHRVYVKLLMAVTTRGAEQDPRASSAHQWLELLDDRMRLGRQWRTLFEQFDVVIAPSFGSLAFRHLEHDDWRKRSLTIDGRETPYGAQLAWPGVATLPGLPATAVPIASSAEELPIGVQVIGPALEDRTPLAIAQALERMHTH